MKQTDKYIALLRGVNVSGRNQIRMADLCRLVTEIGGREVQSYIQSGNLVFLAAARPTDMESKLEQTIERQFKLKIPVLVRPAADWAAYVAGNPFPQESDLEPNRVMLALAKAAPKAEAVTELRARCAGGETIRQVGDALWIHFPGGVGSTKISPALLDRLAGSPVTMRNWRTVLKLNEMTMS